jgi:DNA-binding winged helix-turn-helix (wHTH) protein
MKLDIEIAENCYSHIPNAVCEHEDIMRVLWKSRGINRKAVTSRTGITKKIHI